MDRTITAGSAALIAFVAAMHVSMARLPAGSSSAMMLANVGLPFIETIVLALACTALVRNRTGHYRWTWLFLCLWLAANLFADLVWAWYEIVLNREVPVPSAADAGYLLAYPLALLTVVASAWKTAGRLRAVEAGLDAMMVTVGAAGLMWPLLLAPLVQSTQSSAEYWITLAYPLGDLLVITAFAFLALGSLYERPPRFLLVLLLAFFIQVIADTLYFIDQVGAASYTSGSSLDSLWMLTFAVAGAAALMGLSGPVRDAAGGGREGGAEKPPRAFGDFKAGLGRLSLPYLAFPALGAMVWMESGQDGVRWNTETQILACLGILLVGLVVIRQCVTLAHNRRLNVRLALVSRELREQVGSLADLTERLGELNRGATRLNGLRTLDEVVESGLQLACSVTRSSAGSIRLVTEDGTEMMWATCGTIASDFTQDLPSADAREVGLEVHGESIGTLTVVPRSDCRKTPELLEAAAAQIATAIDNVRRFEETLLLAERDPLTGLLNHRGIHRHLAAAGSQASERGGELSVVMIDLDDFKLLNDTYGHQSGDRVLSQVSDAVRDALRHTDLAGRVGGDEILIVLPDTDRRGAIRLAERIHESLRTRPFSAIEGRSIPLRISLGVACYPDDADTLPALLEVADANLYLSKQRGGNIITASADHDPLREHEGTRGVIARLMDLIGARDHYTRRHSERVVVHALHLGKTLGLSDDSLETLRLAAVLHDVGKISVGDRLLRKPASLAPREEEEMRRHVETGEKIIRDLPRVAQVLEAVRSHHEHFDGTGYPLGLVGNDIPLLARILAVADAFAAMTLDRPYRERMTNDQARSELAKAAGVHLDPHLVSRFLDHLEDELSPTLEAAG